MKVLNFLLFMSVTFIFFGCSSVKFTERELTVFLGCDNIEVLDDIEYSVKNISDCLESSNITIKIERPVGRCGYSLKNGTKVRQVSTALTDIDLFEICKEFFQIEYTKP